HSDMVRFSKCLAARSLGVLLLLIPALCSGQNVGAGQKQFDSSCASCHGGDGNGGEHGPAITQRIATRDNQQLATIIHSGFPGSGMPAFNLPDSEIAELVAYLRTLRPPPGQEIVKAKVTIEGEGSVEGDVLGSSADEMQLRIGGKISLLRKTPNGYRRVTSQTDWPTYHGDIRGNRYSPLSQIDVSNVARLSPAWVFTVPNAGRLQVTPLVAGGIMYVTVANECYSLDAGTGRQLWHYSRPRTTGLTGNAAGGINRGVALAGDRVFMVTDNAHLLALDKNTGSILWETEMADWHVNYNATSAPLAAGGLVISGTAGGDEGARGFVAAFDQATGKEAWRFWTVPKPGEPGSETWGGKDLAHPASAAWFTGSYDEQLGTVFWQTGNPGNDLNGDDRPGDNLYSCSIVALDIHTGKLKWYFQYTPHDVWDWDAAQPPVLVDTNWQGTPRKLLLHANRNGFFYILDRTNGKLLLAKPFVKKLTWAKEIGADGRPVKIPGKEPTAEGNLICPALEGATNWYSTSFHPGTGLYYLQTLERCNIYVKQATDWQAGKSFFGGTVRAVPDERPQKILRAIDIQTGRIVWEVPETGSGESWGGVLSTAGGVVFFGDDSGWFSAVDAKSGGRLWHFPLNDLWKASPMTYVFDGKQHVAVASGGSVFAFSLR
ncbi:MAG TPA: PQQ-binding-like beta-propeller repeat protein, partial [Bryobacteraceae bacterium]